MAHILIVTNIPTPYRLALLKELDLQLRRLNHSVEVVFAGDTIFCESIGRTDLPGGSYRALIQSIKTKLMVLDDDVKLLPGHGPTTTVGWERRRNPFLQ